MRKFKIREKLIRKAELRKYLKKMVDDIDKVSFSKDTLFDYLYKRFSGVNICLDIPKKHKYLYCFSFSTKLGGISLNMNHCELDCDFFAITLKKTTVNRINKIVNSIVTI